jgi:hypothetical protein
MQTQNTFVCIRNTWHQNWYVGTILIVEPMASSSCVPRLITANAISIVIQGRGHQEEEASQTLYPRRNPFCAIHGFHCGVKFTSNGLPKADAFALASSTPMEVMLSATYKSSKDDASTTRTGHELVVQSHASGQSAAGQSTMTR